MKKKIFFICDWDLTHLMTRMAFRLENENFECSSALIVWLTYYIRLNNNVIKSPFKDLYLLQDILEDKNPERHFNLKKIKKLEEKYWIPTLWIYLWADRNFVFDTYEKNVWRMISLFEYFEKIYKKEKPDFVITNCYASLPHIISYFVWTKLWIKFINPVQIRLLPITFFSDSPYETNMKINKPSTENKKDAKMIVKRMQQNAKQWEFYWNKWNVPQHNINLNSLPNLFRFGCRYFYRYYISREYQWDHTKKSPFSRVYDILEFRVLKFLMYSFYKFDELEKKQEYIYFPLHLQPEASTMTLAPFYLNQVATLEALSKSIPAHVVIAVKEHQNVIWRREVSYYRELRKYSNVKFINPKLDTLELIRNCKAVFTLTGTASLEAYVVWKPSIMCWNSFFSKQEQICNLYDIPIPKWGDTIKKYLEDYKFDEKKVVDYIAEVIASAYDLKIIEPWDMEESPILSDDNLNKIMSKLLDVLK